jgi:hypothetical protein
MAVFIEGGVSIISATICKTLYVSLREVYVSLMAFHSLVKILIENWVVNFCLWEKLRSQEILCLIKANQWK